MIKRFLLALFLLFTLSPASVLASVFIDQAKLYPAETSYDVYRKGELIGSYRLMFEERSPSSLSVEVDMQLDMKVFALFRYQYRYTASEVWRDDQLTSLSVSIDSNGKKKSVTGRRENGSLMVTDADGRLHQYNGDLVTIHHWFDLMLKQQALLNTITGQIDQLSVESLGTATLDLGDETIQLSHFSLGADLDQTETWYDNQGRWRALKFNAKDGSVIQIIWRGAKLIE